MADEEIHIKVVVDGTDQATAGLNRVAGSTQKLGEGAKASGPALGDLRQGIGGIGQALAQVNPAIGQSIGALQGLGTSVMSAGTAMGPLGMALGAVAAATAVVVTELTSASAKMAEMRQSTIQATESLGAFVRKALEASAAARETQRIVSGRDSGLDEQEAAALGLRQRVTALLGEARDAEGIFGGSAGGARALTLRAQAREAMQQLRSIEERIQDIRANPIREESEALSGIEAIRAARDAGMTLSDADARRLSIYDTGRDPRARGGRSRQSIEKQRLLREQQLRQRDLEEQERDRAQRERELEAAMGRFGNGQSFAAGLIGSESALYGSGDVSSRQEFSSKDQEARLERERAEETKRIRDQALEEEKARNAEYQRLWEMGASSALSAVRGLMRGDSQARKQRLKEMAEEELFLGIAATAIAVGNTIFNPPGAASKYAEAGIHFSLAGAYGAGSASISGGRGSGGASSGGRARPDRISAGNTGAGSSVTVVNNLNAPAVVTPGGLAEIGLQVIGTVRAARDRYGEAA